MLSARGTLHGHAGVRQAAELLNRAIKDADRDQYQSAQCHHRVAMLEWSTQGRHSSIRHGVDTYLIEDGRIVAQTIHYTVTSRKLSMNHLGGEPNDGNHETA